MYDDRGLQLVAAQRDSLPDSFGEMEKFVLERFSGSPGQVFEPT